MADQAFRETGNSDRRNFESSNRSVKGAADQGLSAKELKEKVSDFANSSGEAARQQASEFADAAKEMGADAADRVEDMLDTQKDAGARYVGGIAEAMRRAAREFDKDIPIAGTYLRKAAGQVDAVSDQMRRGDFNELLQDAQNFARRQPTAFLGISVLAGFGIVRFLKSTAEHSSGHNVQRSREAQREETAEETVIE